MEWAEVVARRRMVRRFDPGRPVPPAVVDTLLDAARRAPSAGFSQGVSFLVLESAADRELFWTATSIGRQSKWLAGMQTAPLLVPVWTSEQTYLDRYAEPDKRWTDRDPARWSAPYWWVDAGMGALLVLLGAVDAGLGACFFGVPVQRQEALREAFGVPADQLSVGVLAVGHPGPGGVAGSPSRRPRRPYEQVVRRGRW